MRFGRPMMGRPLLMGRRRMMPGLLMTSAMMGATSAAYMASAQPHETTIIYQNGQPAQQYGAVPGQEYGVVSGQQYGAVPGQESGAVPSAPLEYEDQYGNKIVTSQPPPQRIVYVQKPPPEDEECCSCCC